MSSPPVIVIAGRPKAALLFWFFGDFIDLELAIDPLPPPPRGSFVHYDFLKLHYIRNKMTHVSPLYVGALTCDVNVNYTTQNYIFRLR